MLFLPPGRGFDIILIRTVNRHPENEIKIKRKEPNISSARRGMRTLCCQHNTSHIGTETQNY